MGIRRWQPTAGSLAPNSPGRLRLLLIVLLLCWTPGGEAEAQKRSTRSGTHGARAGKRRPPHSRRVRWKVKRDIVAGGRHWRLSSQRGVIHVYRPPGYRHHRAGLVLYVHGYHVSVDRTWRGHRLAEQFRSSQQNALFIAVGGPTGPTERVKFGSLREVLRLVARKGRIRMPRQPHVVAMAHSSGIRTLSRWLTFRNLSHVILLDAFFSSRDKFFAWLATHRLRQWHRLTLVGGKSTSNCLTLLARFKGVKGVVRRKNIPTSYEGFTGKERWARLLFMRPQYGHSALVYNRKVIPVLLRRTRLRARR